MIEIMKLVSKLMICSYFCYYIARLFEDENFVILLNFNLNLEEYFSLQSQNKIQISLLVCNCAFLIFSGNINKFFIIIPISLTILLFIHETPLDDKMRFHEFIILALLISIILIIFDNDSQTGNENVQVYSKEKIKSIKEKLKFDHFQSKKIELAD